MTDFSEKIFSVLEPTLESGLWYPMKDLQRILDVNDRALQAHKGNPGILDHCAEEIFRTKNVFLITRTGKGGGVKLTRSVKEVKHSNKRMKDNAEGMLLKVRRNEKWILEYQQLKLVV